MWNRMHLEQLMKSVTYKKWSFRILEKGDGFLLQCGWANNCQRSRKWYVSPHMTKSEVVQTAFKMVVTAEEHEAREQFQFRGVPIFNPHFNVDDKVQFVQRNWRWDGRAEKK
jgi:hypothetical protein